MLPGDRVVYIKVTMPDGSVDYFKLRRSLYGLRISPRAMNMGGLNWLYEYGHSVVSSSPARVRPRGFAQRRVGCYFSFLSQ